jgi:hypothetical protein
MAESHREIRTFPATLALLLAVLGAASMVYYHQGFFMPRVEAARAAQDLGHGYSFGNDFYQVWLSSRELLRQRRNPYAPEMTREIQVGLYGRPLDPNRRGDPTDRRVFPYPLYADLLFWPTAEFSFPAIRVVTCSVLLALTFASIPLWLRAFDWNIGLKWATVIALLTLTSYPSLEGLFAGQLGLLVAFLFAASLLALRCNRFLLAGFLMALATIKPQSTALVIFYLLVWTRYDWQARKRFWVGFWGMFAVLLGSSLVVMPNWIREWAHTILAYRHYTQPPLVTEVLTSPLGPVLSGPASLLLTAASIVLAIFVSWRNRAAAFGSFAFWLTLSLIVSLTTITILPGQAVYDHLILIPAILLLVRRRSEIRQSGRIPRILLSVGALVLFWPWIAAFALIVMRPFIPSSTFDSTPVFSLPIRAAAPLSFAVLALLGWMSRISRNLASA